MRVRGGATPQVDYAAKQKQLDQAKKKLETAKIKREKAEKALDSFEDTGGKIGKLQTQRREAKKALDASPRTKLPGESDDQYQSRMKKQQMDVRMFGQTSEDRDFKDLDDQLKGARQKVYAGTGTLQEQVKSAKAEEKQAFKEFSQARKEMKTAVKKYSPVVKQTMRAKADALDAKAAKAGREADKLEPKIQTKSVEYDERTYKTKDIKGKTKTHRVALPARTTNIFRTDSQKAQLHKDVDEHRKLRREQDGATVEAMRLRGRTSKFKKDELAELHDLKKKMKE